MHPITKATHGTQIHNSSLANTSTPRFVKNAVTLIGDTSIGRNGRKERADENGAKNATPSPPLVIGRDGLSPL